VLQASLGVGVVVGVRVSAVVEWGVAEASGSATTASDAPAVGADHSVAIADGGADDLVDGCEEQGEAAGVFAARKAVAVDVGGGGTGVAVSSIPHVPNSPLTINSNVASRHCLT